MPITRKNIVPTVESTSDKVHRTIRAGLGLLPYGSGTAVEIFSALVTPPLEERKNKWMIDITESIQALEKQKRLKMSDIFLDERFITTLVHVSSIAIKNHEREKLNALRNFVSNVALNPSIDEGIESILLRTIENCSGSHILYLQIVKDVKDLGKHHALLIKNIPDYEQDRENWSIISSDLYNLQLLDPNGLTSIAKQLLKYIEKP